MSDKQFKRSGSSVNFPDDDESYDMLFKVRSVMLLERYGGGLETFTCFGLIYCVVDDSGSYL